MSSAFSSVSVKQQTAAMQRQLLGSLPKKLQGLAAFGLRALVRIPFVSCNANARMAGAGTGHAAEMRMTRLLRHQRLASLLMRTVQRALPLDDKSVLNVDFSNFGGVAALVAARQTKRGRALPWALEALTSNTQGTHAGKPGYARHKAAYQEWKRQSGGDQYDTVLRLVVFIDRQAALPPALVFDRGFGNKRLLAALFARKGNSYVRIRDDFRVEVDSPGGYLGIWYVRDLPKGNFQVRWKGLAFRLVVATTNDSKQNSTMTPWAIATNDQTTTAQQIAKLYYYRFEIEETFRDWKSGLGFRRARLQRWQNLQVLLSFASIATLLAWQATVNSPLQAIHPKKQLSFFRRWHETMQHMQRQVRLRGPAALAGG
jgi:hypothetical protein